ncbi:DegT/DnrJ/EryC1/StrS family aminotransferase [Aestuariimicrobium ganziense]|uniref:DegT/DnrJ/EryC1/StrS family aminotransferase n=1 Tax=Aestuariimicrobium ganziense TaxID=2773677 RepID=UPI0019403DDB|nr:DegT/DnrJ/EryC1/StrS family aminotransferase [Aestuariimicrobium ganziense]
MDDPRLAINGGPKAVTDDLPEIYPGGMRIGEEEIAAVTDTLRTKRLFRFYGPVEGPSKVEAFEVAAAQVMGTKHALAVNSGTAALCIAMAALGIGPGDEVIVPAFTWVSSAAAATTVGAQPVVADVDESLTLDPTAIEARITDATKAIVVVHMRGVPADMDAILEVANRHGIPVIEDTAQAFGASYKGRRLGSMGTLGTYSLQFNKIITCGEGGLVVTNDTDLYERAQMFHDVAAIEELDRPDRFVATVSRMSELQGAVIGEQLKKLEPILADCRRHGRTIVERTADVVAAAGCRSAVENDPEGLAGISKIWLAPDAATAQWVAEALSAEGCEARALFTPSASDLHDASHWGPLHEGVSWRGKSFREMDAAAWGRSDEILGRAIHIDVMPDLTDAQVDQVVEAVTRVFGAVAEKS